MNQIARGEIWWSEMPVPQGSEAGYDRPVIVVQHDRLNQSRLATIIVVPLTGKLQRAALETNILIPRRLSKLSYDSLAIAHLVAAIERDTLRNRVSALPERVMLDIDEALAKCVGLWE